MVFALTEPVVILAIVHRHRLRKIFFARTYCLVKTPMLYLEHQTEDDMTPWQNIKAKAANLKDERGHLTDMGHAVDDVLDRARINADDTIYVEKSRPETDYDEIAYGSIAGFLCGSDDELRGDYWKTSPNQIRAWFKRHGYRW
jgi:hypothetical protein